MLTLKKITLSLIAAGLLLSGCAAPVPADQAVAQPASPLVDCKYPIQGTGTSIEARCGSVAVPEDPAQPDGRQIKLNVVVYPAMDRNPQPDPVFLIAGGPGEAATESYPPLLGAFSRLHQKRDLVMIDQRGTGQSGLLSCGEEESETQAEAELSDEESLEETRACRRDLQGDPNFYTTPYALADLDAVRQKLGYDTVNLLGVSYGTRVALAYLRDYPEAVRSVTLDSLDPTDWNLGPQNPANAQRALDMIVARCTADSACQAAYPNLNQEIQALQKQVTEKPVPVSLRHPVSGEKIEKTLDRKQLGFALQMLSYEPETAALIPLLVHGAYTDGSYDLLLAQALNSQGTLSGAISTGVYLSVLCAEDAPYYPAQPAAGEFYLDNPAQQMQSVCQAWNVKPLPQAYKEAVRSDKPVLLLSGEADPITPPANAETAARTLSNSRVIVAPGMGHAVFMRGCLPKLISDFVNSADPQGLDATCAAEIKPQPFFTSYSGTQP